MSLIKEAITLIEEQQHLDAIALFEDVAKAMQPYVTRLNVAAQEDGSNPFAKDAKNTTPIAIDGFAAFLSGLKILLDRETRRNAYAEDFGSAQKDYEFLSNVGTKTKKFGEDQDKTAQQRIMEIGKQAKTLWKEYTDRINNWSDEKVKQKLVLEIKKLVQDWDRQMNAIKTEYNQRKMPA